MFISIGKVSKIAGVSKSTLRRWEKYNYLVADHRTKGIHRRYGYNKILKYLELAKEKSQKEVFIYARVSASKQKDDLKRQIESMKDHAYNNNWAITGIYKAIASDLNDGRKDLLRMISNIPTKLPDMILCAYRARVARFGTKLLEQICSIYYIYDVQLVESQVKEVSEEENLVHSIIAILTSFSGKLYRSRRGRIKEIPMCT